ncbi:MAG TPA: HAD family hydrolase [Syntrophothermus lipocalidus]|nr:HAD family hydrolase [Syntrophothermus lipocalidus]
MMRVTIPGRGELVFNHLFLDMNGTLTLDGQLLPGVKERIEQLKSQLEVVLLTADTFGTGARVAEELGITLQKVSPEKGGKDKARLTASLRPEGVVAIGNGFNDCEMMEQALLSIAVIGPEGCCGSTLQHADIVVNNISDGLDLLLNPLRLVATLRN